MSIEDRNGEVLEENRPRADAVAAPEDVYIVTNMMEGVLDEGTGKTARQLGFTAPAAGKTGTTDYYTDGWFVGFTPSIAAGVWVGFDLKNPLGDKMTGARVALPAWTEFMKVATGNNSDDVFPVPPGIARVEICSESGLLPTSNCPHTVVEVFRKGAEPTEYCDIHSELSLIRAQTEESFRSFDSNVWDEEFEAPPSDSNPSTPKPETP